MLLLLLLLLPLTVTMVMILRFSRADTTFGFRFFQHNKHCTRTTMHTTPHHTTDICTLSNRTGYTRVYVCVFGCVG